MVDLSEDQLLDSSNGDALSTFLASFPTKLHYTKPKYDEYPWVFWSQDQPSQTNIPFSDDPVVAADSWMIHDKIKSSFSEFDGGFWLSDLFIQFWAPVTTGGRRVLTTCDQPFGVKLLDTGLEKHRLCCLNYRYNLEVHVDVDEDPAIITGAPASAFLNQLPEMVEDLRVHQGCPLVDSALECGLMMRIVLPICDPSRGSCVGVIEFLMKKYDHPVQVLRSLNKALKKVELSTFNARDHLQYKKIHNLQRVRDEIGKALKVICEVLHLHVAQVWIPYEDSNHLPFSSSLNLGTKLVGYLFHDDDYSYGNYLYFSDKMPLKMGEGLVGKTLEQHEPHFCRNISQLSNVKLPMSIISKYECRCLTMCLRSNYTYDLDYVLEFLWTQSTNVLLLELLFFMLKRCLPSFKFASNTQLGNELYVVDVDNSLGNEVRHLKIYQETRPSPIPKTSGKETRLMIEECVASTKAKGKTTPKQLSREMIEQQFENTMEEAAIKLEVSRSTLKRKCKDFNIRWPRRKFGTQKVTDSHSDQTEKNEGQSVVNLDENTLFIKVKYEDDMIMFNLPILSATFVVIGEEIKKTFKLNHETYKIKYHDEDGDLILIANDQHMRDYIRRSTSLNKNTIKLCVIPAR